jgi:hypothetical protein
MNGEIRDAGLADCDGRRGLRNALGRERIGFDERSVGVHDLVGLGVEEIERVELDLPAVVEGVTQPGVEDAGRRGAEGIVLGERRRAEVAPAQRAEPAGSLAEPVARSRPSGLKATASTAFSCGIR